jgi:hypothetical protein
VVMNVREKPASISAIKYFPLTVLLKESLPRNTKKKANNIDNPSRNQKSRYGEKFGITQLPV